MMATKCFHKFKLVSACGLLICFALLTPNRASAEKYALLIGAGDYAYQGVQVVTPLPKAEQDARDMARALKKIGWRGLRSEYPDVIASEVTKKRIIEALNQTRRTLNSTDEFLLFFAGHGVRDIEIEGAIPDYYWLTHLTELESLSDRGILFEDFMRDISKIPATKKLILLDHCFGGQVVPVPSSGLASAGRAADDLSELTLQKASRSNISNPIEGGKLNPELGSGTVVIAADRDFAFEDENNGIFTSVLLKALSSHRAAGVDGILELQELMVFVNDQVKAEATAQNVRQAAVVNGDYRDLFDWTVADNLPKGTYVIPGIELEKMCRQWKKNNQILVVHNALCRSAVNYKKQRDNDPKNYPIDPQKEELYLLFAEHAVAVMKRRQLADEILFGLCQELQVLENEEPSECSG